MWIVCGVAGWRKGSFSSKATESDTLASALRMGYLVHVCARARQGVRWKGRCARWGLFPRREGSKQDLRAGGARCPFPVALTCTLPSCPLPRFLVLHPATHPRVPRVPRPHVPSSAGRPHRRRILSPHRACLYLHQAQSVCIPHRIRYPPPVLTTLTSVRQTYGDAGAEAQITTLPPLRPNPGFPLLPPATPPAVPCRMPQPLEAANTHRQCWPE